MLTIGVDVGGTFTDFVVFDEVTNSLSTRKVPSTPKDPAQAVLTGLGLVLDNGISPDQVNSFLHGSTITTNALLQRRGAKTGLFLTKGLKGIFQVQSQMTSGPAYSTTKQRPPELIDELDVFEIPERIDRDGKIVLELDEDVVLRAAEEINARGIESLAICYVFSYANKAHEQRTQELLSRAAPKCRVFCSTDILPRIREWSRMSTTILDAYLEPVLVDYVGNLAKGLKSLGVATNKTFLMASNGGVMPFSALALGGKAVHTLLSGPAAAVQAAKRLAESRGVANLVTIDIGGTSCDVAFVRAGAALEVTAGSVAGYEVFVPMLDIATIGAGGGTIARADADGRLQVGPESAGADPGPAAYGRGGQQATITDADVVLGYLNPDYFLGGALALDADKATAAITRNIAEPLGLGVAEAAISAVRINDVHMAEAVRAVAAKAGVSLAECHLVACGGAGPVHAAAIAEELGIPEVLVPRSPGVFAALGLLCTDIAEDYVQTDIGLLEDLDPETIASQFGVLERKAIDEYAIQGFRAEEVVFVREVDARYPGQGFEIRVVVDDPHDVAVTTQTARRFHTRHREIYGHSSDKESVEIVSYRIRAVIAMPQYQPSSTVTHAASEHAASTQRDVYFDTANGFTTTHIYKRSGLSQADLIKGPAIIEQQDTTTVIPPGWVASMDSFGTLAMRKQ